MVSEKDKYCTTPAILIIGPFLESSDTFRSPARKDVVATRVTAADVLTGCS